MFREEFPLLLEGWGICEIGKVCLHSSLNSLLSPPPSPLQEPLTPGQGMLLGSL